jgi:AraC family transcriptional regulator
MMAGNDRHIDYARRIHAVVAYIDRHLADPLELEVLSGVANFSPYHFHRLFSAWMGERLGDYLRRRRVETAAVRLSSQPQMTILEVALTVGFGSGEAFSRAFKSHFGCSPTAWRARTRREEKRNRGQAVGNPGQAAAPSQRDDGVPKPHIEVPMNVSIVDRAEHKVVYLRRTGAYGEGLSAFWQEEVYPWMVTHGWLGQARYGISLDDPSITAPERCRYDACVELAPGQAAPKGVLSATIPGGRYAALQFKGTVEALGAAWDALLRDWLPVSGMQLDSRPMFEYYPVDAAYDAETGAMECQVCIPVMPL